MTFMSELKRLREAAYEYEGTLSHKSTANPLAMKEAVSAVCAYTTFLDNHAEAIEELVRAAENLRDVKGRHHTEIATTQLFEALAKLEKP